MIYDELLQETYFVVTFGKYSFIMAWDYRHMRLAINGKAPYAAYEIEEQLAGQIENQYQ